MPAARPLHRRKRVWLGGIGVFILGAGLVAIGNQSQVAQAEALVAARPTVTATATATGRRFRLGCHVVGRRFRRDFRR